MLHQIMWLYPVIWYIVSFRQDRTDRPNGRRCTNRLGTFKISHARNPCFEQLYVRHVNDDPENPDAELIVLCASCHMKWHRKPGSNGKASPRKQGYKVISINQLLIYLAAAGFSVRPNEECRVSWRIGPFEAEAADPIDALVMALHWLSAEVSDLQAESAKVKAELKMFTGHSQAADCSERSARSI